MPNQITYKVISDAREYVSGMKPAIRTVQQFRESNQDLERIGVKTTAQFRKELTEIERLTVEYKKDALAVSQLTAKKRALVGEMQRVETEAVGGKKAVGGLTTGVGALRAGVAAFAASGAVRIFTDFARAGIEGQQNIALLQGSINAAQREFGEATGTQEEWLEITKDLGEEFRFLSDNAINRAAASTVGMTKRLGLNVQQMEVLLQRTAALSIGKVNLEDAITRTTAALRGEAESAEVLELTLNADFIKAQALARGLDKELWPALTNVQLAQLRYIELLAQSEEAMGNVNDLAATQAARVQNLAARWDDLKTRMGNALLQGVDAAGVFDVLEGKISSSEFSLRLHLLMTGQFTKAQMLADEQNRKAIDTVDELTTAYETFRKSISSLSPEVAQGLDEAAFRAAAQAGTLADFRRDVFSRASDAIIKKIEEEARKRMGAAGAAKSYQDQQADAVGKLTSQLAQLNSVEAERIGHLLHQQEVLKDQIKARSEFLKMQAASASEAAFRERTGAPLGPSALAPRAQDRLPTPGRSRVTPFVGPDGGIKFIRELLQPLDQLREKGVQVSAETQRAIDEIVKKAQDEKERLADALADPFDRAGLALDTWLTRTQEGMTFLGESVAEVAFGIGDAFGSLFDTLVQKETDALVRAGYSREEANKRAIESQKTLFNISKGLSIAGAIADTYAAANKALASAPPPINYALMAAVIAAGIANVAKIAATSPGGTSGAGGATTPSASSRGTTSFTPFAPAPVDQANITLGGFASQAAQQTALAGKLDEVVEAVNAIDARTVLKDDHVLIQMGRAQGRENNVGV